jgi:hypothetical protein
MVIRLRWEEKVVASILIALFIFSNGVCQEHASANALLHKKITVKETTLSFEQVLQRLSSQTKLYFIYSSNTVAANKPVTVDFNQKPLKDVFKSLENQMNVSFRTEGNYVIVKKGSVAKELSAKTAMNSVPSFNHASRNVTTFASAAPHQSFQKRTPREYSFAIPYQTLQKNLLQCRSDLSVIDTSAFKKYTPLQITNPRRFTQVFTSIRMIANEYSGGVEIHAGIPALYAVINGGLMKEGYFRYGYGLGTSINLKPRLTFQPIYTFATLKQKQDYVVDHVTNLVIADGLKLTGYHHQLKFILQYKLSSRVRVHVGPTFNFLKTNYAYTQAKRLLYDVTTVVASPTNQRYTAPSVGVRRSIYIVNDPADGYSVKSWSGFEAGISYLIKFPRH